MHAAVAPHPLSLIRRGVPGGRGEVSRNAFNSTEKGIVIRGEDKAEAKQSIWSDVPLNQFLINEGETNVDLSDVVSRRGLRGIRAVAAKSLYVIDEIEFDDSGNMTIKVTPIDKRE